MRENGKATVGAPSNVIQRKRNLTGSETGYAVNKDTTTDAEKRGDCFCPSANDRVLEKNHGFGKVRPTIEDHQGNKGLDTLSSDSRNAPLPESGVKLDIHGRRRDENAIGRSINDVNDDCTVAGEDLYSERKNIEHRDIARGKGEGFQIKEKNSS